MAVGATVVVIALAVNAADVDSPAGLTAAVTLSGAREAPAPGGGTTRVADVAVRLSRPELAEGADWAYVLGWQGGGRHYDHLVRAPDGVLRSVAPVPVGGDWKAFVRVHKGRAMLSVPVRMPPDPALGFAGYPARAQTIRLMRVDTELLQLERRDDGPLWAWTPALLLVMALNLALMVAIAAACVRAGRASRRRPHRPPAGSKARLARRPPAPRPHPVSAGPG